MSRLPCQKKRKTLELPEPVFYHEPPKVLVQELMHMAAARGIIDLTAGSGVWAEAALEAQVPYFGLVLTDVHLSELRAHLIKQAADG